VWGAHSPACTEFLAMTEEEYGKNTTSSFLRDARETVAAIKADGVQNLRVSCFEREIQML